MEQIIIIILLIIIVLILLDNKFLIKVREKDDNKKTNLPSIMGKTKQKERQALPIEATERHQKYTSITEANFESETGKRKADDVIQNANLNDILVKEEEKQEEEEEEEEEQEEEDWKYQHSNAESGFATGVTFQELSTAGQLLQDEVLEPDLEKQAITLIQKIQGTELFDLLENSLGDASKRIASLLAESTSREDEIHSSTQGNSLDGFDIGKFV